MEVKPSYKQTEVGAIPENWDLLPFSALGAVIDGDRGVNYPSDQDFSESGYCLFLNAGNVTKEGFRFDECAFITQDKDRKLGKGKLKRQDIVLTTRGTVGNFAYFDLKVPFDNLRINSGMVLLRSESSAITPRFLYTILQSHLVSMQIERLSFGSAQPQLTVKGISGLGIVVPPVAEQAVIASILCDVEELLDGLDSLIAKKRDLKQAAMQQLLTGKTRLPDFKPAQPKFVKTTIGVYPPDWELTELSTLVEPGRSIRYGIVQPGEYDAQGRYMIRGQDYSEVKGWANPSEIFRVSAAIEERYRNARVKVGDLIMTIVGYCGHVEMVPEWLDGANLTQTTARIAIDSDKAVGSFCKYMLLSPAGRNQVAANLKGAAQPGLNCGDIEHFLLPLPSIAEQRAVTDVLTDMDAELIALEARRNKTRDLKQAMMQELLTGKTRLFPAGTAHA
jgi:type I restriction enzyme S subunit